MSRAHRGTTAQPTIIGPAAWPANGAPPEFRVDAAGMSLYMVELAAARRLMSSVVDRSPDNYFYGGDAENVFATGPAWCVPRDVWTRLGRVRVLYYRVVAFDQAAGGAALSVDDQHLNNLPVLIVEAGERPHRGALS